MEYLIKIRHSNKIKSILVSSDLTLRESLISQGIVSDYPCGGRGTCKKCKAKVLSENGREILLCRTYPVSDMEIELFNEYSIDFEIYNKTDDNVTVCCDVGTTTLEFTVINSQNARIAEGRALNPQSIFGSDVLSRIDACKKYSVKKLQEPIINTLKNFISLFIEKNGNVTIDKIYVCANTVLSHIFAGISPESISKYPYVTSFIGTKTFSGRDFDLPAYEIILLPCHSAFFGSDALVGLCNTDLLTGEKPSLYVDFGTNGEMCLKSNGKFYLTSTAVGPCFEGVNISCGMGGVNGAINLFWEEDGELKFSTIGNKKPLGVCGAGLISAISYLKDKHLIDKSGRIFKGDKIELVENIYLSQKDVNEFMLAKSAIKSGIEVLLNRAKISARDVKKVYLAGSLGNYIEIYSVLNCGILPMEFRNKCVKVGKNAIVGTEEYAKDIFFKDKLEFVKENAELVDLSLNQDFSHIFSRNIDFN